MTGIIVVFPKQDEARGIRNLLVRNGFTVIGYCTTGAQAMQMTDDLSDGIVISAYRLQDMIYSRLQQDIPDSFEMLLIASDRNLAECDTRSITSLALPLKVGALMETVGDMVSAMERRRKRLKNRPKERKPEEIAIIQKAKDLLMEKKGYTEDQAHKYIQKHSMDNGTGLVETAQMVLTMFGSLLPDVP